MKLGFFKRPITPLFAIVTVIAMLAICSVAPATYHKGKKLLVLSKNHLWTYSQTTAVSTKNVIYDTEDLTPYSRITVSVYNESATTPLTNLYLELSDDTLFHSPVDLVASASSVLHQSSASQLCWTNCTNTLPFLSKCYATLDWGPGEAFFAYFRAEAYATNEVTVEVRLTGKI